MRAASAKRRTPCKPLVLNTFSELSPCLSPTLSHPFLEAVRCLSEMLRERKGGAMSNIIRTTGRACTFCAPATPAFRSAPSSLCEAGSESSSFSREGERLRQAIRTSPLCKGRLQEGSTKLVRTAAPFDNANLRSAQIRPIRTNPPDPAWMGIQPISKPPESAPYTDKSQSLSL